MEQRSNWVPPVDIFARVRGDARYKHRRELLERLASNSTSPAMAELAKGLLSGSITPRQVMSSGAYGELIGEHLKGFTAWYGSLTESEREKAADQGRAYLDELERAEMSSPKTPSAQGNRKNRRPEAETEEPSYDETDWTSE